MIDHVILSMDNNPLYADFWMLNCKLWQKIGVKPILIKIGDHDSIDDDGEKIVINRRAIENIDTGFQAQISRLWAAMLFPEKTSIISDIDMLPLNKNYFFENIKQYDSNQILSFFSNAYDSETRQPMCYLFASGNVFREIISSSIDYREFVNTVYEFCGKKERWTADEDYFEFKLSLWLKDNGHRLVRIHREKDNFNKASNRIDRLFIDINKQDEYVEAISQFYDMHCPRPYISYKDFIDNIVNAVLKKL
jgi:hypothetical protein